MSSTSSSSSSKDSHNSLLSSAHEQQQLQQHHLQMSLGLLLCCTALCAGLYIATAVHTCPQLQAEQQLRSACRLLTSKEQRAMASLRFTAVALSSKRIRVH